MKLGSEVPSPEVPKKGIWSTRDLRWVCETDKASCPAAYNQEGSPLAKGEKEVGISHMEMLALY